MVLFCRNPLPHCCRLRVALRMKLKLQLLVSVSGYLDCHYTLSRVAWWNWTVILPHLSSGPASLGQIRGCLSIVIDLYRRHCRLPIRLIVQLRYCLWIGSFAVAKTKLMLHSHWHRISYSQIYSLLEKVDENLKRVFLREHQKTKFFSPILSISVLDVECTSPKSSSSLNQISSSSSSCRGSRRNRAVLRKIDGTLKKIVVRETLRLLNLQNKLTHLIPSPFPLPDPDIDHILFVGF